MAHSNLPADVSAGDVKAAERLGEAYKTLRRDMATVIVGQEDVLDQVLLALFCQGHCILEGVPGLAKTLMISSIARLLSLSFGRIQFTPDLMPSDITGTPPKTQAALLQAMQEYHVTVAGEHYPLERPFLVLGTQNPIEQEGTYPLPEAQLDRFMFKVLVDYPSYDDEIQIAESTTAGDLPELSPILDREGI